MTNRFIRRKIYFMPKSFQGKYIFFNFFISIACVAIFTVIFSYLSAGSTSIVYEEYNLKVGSTPTILINQILMSNWLFIITGGTLAGIVTMFLMHRIAGPFYRFNVTLKKMICGDFTDRIILRKNDEGKNIAEKFNSINNFISEKIGELKAENEAAEKSIKKLEKKYGADHDIEELSSITERLKESLNQFKIK